MSQNAKQRLPRLAQRTERRWGQVSAFLFVAAAVATVLSKIQSVLPLDIFAALCLASFVALEFGAIRRVQQIAAALLFTVAISLGQFTGELSAILIDGLIRTLPFLLIFASVGWLRTAAAQSPAVTGIRESLVRLGQSWRFAAVTLTANVVGGGFNLAGVGLLDPIVQQANPRSEDAKRLRCAILWGFSSAPSWSPFIVGSVAILATLDGPQWIETLPYGLTLALCFLGWAVLYDRLWQTSLRHQVSKNEAASHSASLMDLMIPASKLFIALLVLFAVTFGLMEFARLPLTIAIAISAPLFALGWMRLIFGPGQRRQMGRTAAEIFAAYPAMRTETTLFTAANIFGAAVSSYLAQSHVTLPGWTLSSGVPYLDVLMILFGYLAISATGIHPIISLVVFSVLVDPASLSIPLPMLAALMMAMWGMGTAVSPLSGTTLLMSQISGISSFTIAWRWNGPYYLLATLWLALLVTLAK